MALHGKWSSGDLVLYDGATDLLAFRTSTDGMLLYDDIAIAFGDNDDATITFDGTTDEQLEITCSGGIALSGALTVDSASTLSGNLTVQVDGSSSELEITDARVKVPDDIPLTFGDGNDATITYDEAGDNQLEIGGTNIAFQVDGSSTEMELGANKIVFTLANLPTSDPSVSGQLYRSGTSVLIST